MVIRELVTRWGLQVDDRKLKAFNEGIETAKRNAALLVGGAVTLGATLFGLANSAAKFGHDIKLASERLGIGTTQLQKYQYVAGLAGVEAETLNMSLSRLMRYAAMHGESAPLNVLLAKAAERMRTAGSQANRVAIAFQLFGRGGIGMINVLKHLGEAKEAELLGGIMSEKDIAAADEFRESWEKILFWLRGIKNYIGTVLFPVLQPMMKTFLKWAMVNRELIRTNIRRFILEVKDAAFWLFNTVKWGIKEFQNLIDRLGGMTNALQIAKDVFVAWIAISTAAAIGKMAVGVLGVTSAFQKLGWGIAFSNAMAMLTPLIIGGTIIMIGLLIEDLIGMFEGKESLSAKFSDWVISKIEILIADLKEIWALIQEPLSEIVGGLLDRALEFFGVEEPTEKAITAIPTLPVLPGPSPATTATSISARHEVNVNVQGLDRKHAQDTIQGAIDSSLIYGMTDLQMALALGGGGQD